MDKPLRPLIGVLSVLLITVVVSPGTYAQCFPWERQFATVAGGTSYDKVRIDPSGAENSGNEIGRFWQSSDSSLGNNFEGECPSQGEEGEGEGWWQLNQAPLRGLRGYISGPGCTANSCPDGDLTVLVEEKGSPGWPSTAFFIAFRVDETPEGLRWWDLARVDPGESPGVLAMGRFPTPLVQGVEPLDAGLGIHLEFPDVAANVHAVNGPDDTPLPASAIVKSYDLYVYYGTEDPGREVDSWTLLAQEPYEDGPRTISVGVPCLDVGFFLALGLTFQGGDGPDVVSTYVGSSRQFWCFEWPPVPAGAVPDGHFVPGTPLMLDKEVEGGELVGLTLSWGHGCHYGDENHEIYEGILGDFESHLPFSCGWGNTSPQTIQPTEGDTYYLVVPHSYEAVYGEPLIVPSREGSYGQRSNGQQRPRGSSACLPQWIEDCP